MSFFAVPFIFLCILILSKGMRQGWMPSKFQKAFKADDPFGYYLGMVALISYTSGAAAVLLVVWAR